MTSLPAVAALAFGASTVGALGGLGGAVLLVPVLVLAGLDPATAAPIGLLTVVAGSTAASATQIDAGLVHHRVGILTETAATAGAIGGALFAGSVSEALLRDVLAAVALLGAVLVSRRPPSEAGADPAFVAEAPGEWPGTLSGTAPGVGAVSPYTARRPAAAVALTAGAGAVAGASGVSGGYLKTPILIRVMELPPRVAAATTTCTVGITASAALLVYLVRGHIDLDLGAAAVAGAIPGGRLGATLLTRAPLRATQLVLSAALAAAGLVLLLTS